MKRSFLVILTLIIIVVIGYAIYLVIKSDPSIMEVHPVRIDNDEQLISEWREENRTGISAETGLLTSWPEEGRCYG